MKPAYILAALVVSCGPAAAPPAPALMSDGALAAWTPPKDTVWQLSARAVFDSSRDVVYFVDALLIKPERVAGPWPLYPDALKEAGVQGRVLFTAIIDTAGRIEPRSIRVDQSPDSALTRSTVVNLIQTRFRPGRVGDRPVRTLVKIPYDFRLGR